MEDKNTQCEDEQEIVGKAWQETLKPKSVTKLADYRSNFGDIEIEKCLIIVAQAIVLFENHYVHLPLKRASYAVDPVQRLRRFAFQLEQEQSEDAKKAPAITPALNFHREMATIFRLVNDLHMNYLMPQPFRSSSVFLPFLVEKHGDNEFIVTKITKGFGTKVFQRGVKISRWNNIEIGRAVEINGERFGGNNKASKLARGISTLTSRPLSVSLPPDEDRVKVEFLPVDCKTSVTFEEDWWVLQTPQLDPEIETKTDKANSYDVQYSSIAIDLEQIASNTTKSILFKPQPTSKDIPNTEKSDEKSFGEPELELLIDRDNPTKQKASAKPSKAIADSIMEGGNINTDYGEFGYIRLKSFYIQPEDIPKGQTLDELLIGRFRHFLGTSSEKGLIIDVRGNGGGSVVAAEAMLQLLTPKPVVPQNAQLLVSPLNFRLCNGSLCDNCRVNLREGCKACALGLRKWAKSIGLAGKTGAIYSNAFPITPQDQMERLGQQYYGPVVVIANALSFSATDIFVAGFQDHEIGKVIGVDKKTGAGGATLWKHGKKSDDFIRHYSQCGYDSGPYEELPLGITMTVSLQRLVRVGLHSGTVLEDFGVSPHKEHVMTKRDVLHQNEDLKHFAGKVLHEMSPRVEKFLATLSQVGKRTISRIVKLETKGVSRVEVYVDGAFEKSISVGELEEIKIDKFGRIEIRAFSKSDELVATRKF